MANIEKINPGTPIVGPYSPGIKIGNLLFISGQAPAQGATDIEEQTSTALENIKKIIKASGGKVSNIVNTTVFLRDINDFSKMNKSYKNFFNNNGVTEIFPARATIEVSNLPMASMLIEISAIAAL